MNEKKNPDDMSFEQLANSESADLRWLAVIHVIKILDKLADDPSLEVRQAVAKQGYALDKLMNDENKWVRAAVVDGAIAAKRADLLDKLANDETWEVRDAVANSADKAGREDLLEKLANDEHKFVRITAVKEAEKIGYTNIPHPLRYDGYEMEQILETRAKMMKQIFETVIDEWFDGEYIIEDRMEEVEKEWLPCFAHRDLPVAYATELLRHGVNWKVMDESQRKRILAPYLHDYLDKNWWHMCEFYDCF